MKKRHRLGQGLVEYALLLALIAVVAIGGLLFLGGQVKSDLSDVGTRLAVPAAAATPGPTPHATPHATPHPTPTPRCQPWEWWCH